MTLAAVVVGLVVAPLLGWYGVLAARRRRFGGPPLPGPAPRPWLLGNLVPLFRAGVMDAYRAWTVAARDDVLVWAWLTPHFVAARPETVALVLADREAFTREIAPTRHLFGKGLLNLEGEPWRARRSTFRPAFRREELDGAVRIVQEEADALVAAWEERAEPFSPSKDLSFAMLRILGRFLFGFSFDAARHGGKPLHRALVTLSTTSVVRHFEPAWVRLFRGDADERAAVAWLDTVCREVLRDGGPTPFLTALRDGVRDGTLDERAALDEIRTFLVAGHETSATALVWTLALLAAHPDAQDAVRAEALAAGPVQEIAGLQALPATTRVLREALRLYPPVPISISRAVRDVRVGDRVIPAGTRVDVCSYVLHRDPTLWPDPERFDPARFADGEPREPGRYFPFLLGPHTCLGQRFAMMELPVVLTTIVRAFTLAEVVPPRVDLRLSLHPAGFRLGLEPQRTRSSVLVSVPA